uniref:LITAF domain-containing protein n=1 Tax=Nothobranchius furzeri TaxID=105023 RepID=A0A8C6LWH5_NOTFU
MALPYVSMMGLISAATLLTPSCSSRSRTVFFSRPFPPAAKFTPPAPTRFVLGPAGSNPIMVEVQQMPTDCPGQMLCPYCNSTVVTKTEHKPGLLAWFICEILAFLT